MFGLSRTGLFFVLLALLGLYGQAQPVQAQTDGLLQVHDPLHEFLLWQHSAGRLPNAFLSHQPLSAYEAQRYLDTLATRRQELNPVERALLGRYRLAKDSTYVAPYPKLVGIFDGTYENGQDFISSYNEDYSVQVNPLFYIGLGFSSRRLYGGQKDRLFMWQNTRGLRLSGKIGPYIFFESRLEENQRVPVLPEVQKRTAPRLGIVKYDVPIGEIGRTSPYDYSVATGILGFRSKTFEIRFGRDRNHWGMGRSSVQLSNFAPAYDQLQIRTTVGQFQYTNLFAAFSDLSGLADDFSLNQAIPRKYGTFHRLSVNITSAIQLGVFESIVISPGDGGLDVSYLNPIIFYRSLETEQGSPGNAVIGGDFSWVVRKGMQLYTQLILDEFKIAELKRPGRGWFGNKWSTLVGFHFIEPIPGLPNTTLRVEYTRTRPFTYSHFIPNQGYVHHNDFLAHPSGPNSEDLAVFATYHPTPRIQAALNLSMTVRGRNPANENVGADPRVSYLTQTRGDFGHKILQGVPENHLLIELHGGYELLPNLYTALALQIEHFSDGVLGTQSYFYPFAMLRWGLPFQSVRY